MVFFQLRKNNLLYMNQIGIIKTAAATISISALYILYSFHAIFLPFGQEVSLAFSSVNPDLFNYRNLQVSFWHFKDYVPFFFTQYVISDNLFQNPIMPFHLSSSPQLSILWYKSSISAAFQSLLLINRLKDVNF